MGRVAKGSAAKTRRRKDAILRLEAHLAKHRSFHVVYSDEEFAAHDKQQREELKRTWGKA